MRAKAKKAGRDAKKNHYFKFKKNTACLLHHSLHQMTAFHKSTLYGPSLPSKLWSQCIFPRETSLINSPQIPNSPASLGILQHGSHLLMYLKHGVQEPVGSVLTLALPPSQNPCQGFSSFHTALAHCSWQGLSLHCCLAKAQLQWKSCCCLTTSSVTCHHCSHHHSLTHSFSNSLNKTDVEHSCAMQCAVDRHIIFVANLFKPQTGLLRLDIINM